MAIQLDIVIDQIIIFSILMAIGFIAAKASLVSKDILNALSKMIVVVILPALIFSLIADSGLTINDFLMNGRFAIGAVLCYALLIATGVLMSKLLKLKGKTANIFIALAAFGNMGFMGIPLILGIFKEPVAQVCISIFTIIDMTLIWTLGVYLCSRHQDNANSWGAIKNMINPTTGALCVAFIIMLFQVRLPDLFMNTVSGIGNTSKFLTMIYVGGILAYVSMGNIFKKPSIFVLTIVKMLIIPVVVFFFLGFFLPQTPRAILTLIVGLPAMTTIAMIATTYKSDDEYAAEIIFVTTIASLITIPLVSIITSMM